MKVFFFNFKVEDGSLCRTPETNVTCVSTILELQRWRWREKFFFWGLRCISCSWVRPALVCILNNRAGIHSLPFMILHLFSHSHFVQLFYSIVGNHSLSPTGSWAPLSENSVLSSHIPATGTMHGVQWTVMHKIAFEAFCVSRHHSEGFTCIYSLHFYQSLLKFSNSLGPHHHAVAVAKWPSPHYTLCIP